MTEQIINQLPSITWRHLHVNQAAEAAALPDIPAFGWGESSSQIGALPQGTAVIPQADPSLCGLTSGAGESFDTFTRENANFQLHLTQEGAADAPLLVEHIIDKDHPHVISHLTIHAGAGSRLTVVEVVRGDAPAGVHAGLTQVLAEESASVTLIQLQLLGNQSRSWVSVAAQCRAGAGTTLYRASLGGSLSLAGSKANLSGKRSRYSVQSIYYGDADALLDFSDVAEHTGRETRSELHAAGVLAGQCQKTLRGTIDFRRGAVHGVGHESEDVLLLDHGVRNRSVPLILCGEEQVEGQHAATVGRLDENVLYYMASRGISREEAMRLMVLAKFAPVLDALPPNLQCEVNDFVERRLGL